MNLYAIRRRDFWGTPEELQATAARSAEVGDEMSDDIRWIRTYVVQEESGKLGTVCIYEGTSADKVREQAERTGIPPTRSPSSPTPSSSARTRSPPPKDPLKGSDPFRLASHRDCAHLQAQIPKGV